MAQQQQTTHPKGARLRVLTQATALKLIKRENAKKKPVTQ
jgi:hypothetical protein